MLQKIIKIYFFIIILLTPSWSWKKSWRERRRDYVTNTENLVDNRKQFKKRYKAEGHSWSEYNHYRRDYLMCFVFFSLSADEYFQYDFMNKGWLWRNHHVTIERRKFIYSRINDRTQTSVLANKSSFNNYYKDYIHRAWCELKTLSEEEFIETFQHCERVIIKPRGSYGGKGIEVHTADAESLLQLYRKKSKKNYVVEEYLNQQGILHDINPDSLNSIRITSIRNNDKVEIIDGFFRCGCGTAIVDNFSSGGLIFPFDVKSGKVYFGHSKTASKVAVHPQSGIEVAGMILPAYDQIVATIQKVHMMAPEGINLVGWDVCVIDEKVVLIEGNSTPGYTTLYDPKNNLWKRIRKYL